MADVNTGSSYYPRFYPYYYLPVYCSPSVIYCPYCGKKIEPHQCGEENPIKESTPIFETPE